MFDYKEYYKVYIKEYYKKHKEDFKEYYQNNKEKRGEYQREYQEKNRTIINEKARQYYRDNKYRTQTPAVLKVGNFTLTFD